MPSERSLQLTRIDRLSVALMALMALILMTSCQQAPVPEDNAEVPQTSMDGRATDDLAAEDLPAEPTPTWLTSEGWGELRIGMTRQEVVATLGEDANPNAVGGPDPEACDQFRPERAPNGLLVMIEQGRLTRISLSGASGIETEGGLAVGDSASVVRSHFGARAASSLHKYLEAPAEYLTVWTTAPSASDPRGIVYEVGTDARVMHIHAGGPSIQYVEGCL